MRRRKKNKFSYWLARISALIFVILSFVLSGNDLKLLIQENPVVINFFMGTVVLGLTLALWNTGKIGGLIFMGTGIIFMVLNWDDLLIVNVVSTAVWLFLTGLLFIASDLRIRRRSRRLAEASSYHRTIVTRATVTAKQTHAYAHAVSNKKLRS